MNIPTPSTLSQLEPHQEPTSIQALHMIPTDQQKLLKLVIPKVLALSENDTFQTKCLLEQGVPLAQAVRVVKILMQIGVMGPEEANQRSLNRPLAEQLLIIINAQGDGTKRTNAIAAISTERGLP